MKYKGHAVYNKQRPICFQFESKLTLRLRRKTIHPSFQQPNEFHPDWKHNSEPHVPSWLCCTENSSACSRSYSNNTWPTDYTKVQFQSKSKVKVKVKNILFQQDHNIVCINQKHQHSLVKKRLHKRENPAKDGQPRYK